MSSTGFYSRSLNCTISKSETANQILINDCNYRRSRVPYSDLLFVLILHVQQFAKTSLSKSASSLCIHSITDIGGERDIKSLHVNSYPEAHLHLRIMFTLLQTSDIWEKSNTNIGGIFITICADHNPLIFSRSKNHGSVCQ